jgi:RimJ/RimL family protein N-acetyltransferase
MSPLPMSHLLIAEEILGDGLVLRRPTPDDAEQVIAICRDPTIAQNTSVPVDYQPSDFEAFLLLAEAAFSGRVGGHYVIRETNDGPILGAVGVGINEWGAEAGYYLDQSARGRGIASRALRVLTAAAFSQNIKRVYLRILRGNSASVRVAERAGFAFAETKQDQPANGCGVDRATVDIEIYERLAD